MMTIEEWENERAPIARLVGAVDKDLDALPWWRWRPRLVMTFTRAFLVQYLRHGDTVVYSAPNPRDL